MPNKKWTSAGGVVLPDREKPWRVYVVKPSNNYGPWCFPKGKVDPGESKEATAVREVQEEAGVPAELVPGAYLGTGEGQYSITHYYLMVQTGRAGATDFETEEVRLVTFEQAEGLFASAGNQRDVGILARARDYLTKESASEPMKEAKEPINELHLSLLGKVFFTAVAAWLVGKLTNLKIRGTEDEVMAVSNAMMASHRFQEELQSPGATVESVMNKLGLKHASAREFERVLGIEWPL